MITDVRFPKWVGSYLYKGTRYHLRNLVCPGNKNCEKCELLDTCPYYAIFEKKTSSNKKVAPTRPIFLIPPYFEHWKNIKSKQKVKIRLLIFKNIETWIPYIILALNSLGKQGLVDWDETETQKFKVKEILNSKDNSIVYDGTSLFTNNITVYNSNSINKKIGDEIVIDFEVPITLFDPLNLPTLLNKIRNRLINIENEYGTGERIPNFHLKSRIIENHLKKLRLFYRRGNVKFGFNAYIGQIKYKIEKKDKNSDWILSIGEFIGGGKFASFGCGYYKIK